MKELIDFLKGSPLGALATVRADNTPNARPFQFILEKDGRLWFCTSNKKDVFRELSANPRVCFSVTGPDTTYARIWADVRFVGDVAAKAAVLEAGDLVRSIYQSPSNPDFEVFYLEKGTASLCDLKGSPAKEFTL